MRRLIAGICLITLNSIAEPVEISGIYPHLTMYNNEAECGTGAVVPWAERLWVITYGPHSPNGSSDKLYEIKPDLQQIIRPESVGGTHANRMIHRESQQLFIGPYVVDANRTVRSIPTSTLFGRLTGNARHLSEPSTKIYYATMEEGFYEVDVETLAVTELYKDGNARQGDLGGDLLPGCHGKGFYLGQGRVVYANNGERGASAMTDPTTRAGVLAEWGGTGSEWRVARRNQFTEVTGPGGITGNLNPDKDPVWSMGWDYRSLILMLMEDRRWHAYRLPKGSHSYDGAHGWNTEWPRIREIGEKQLLATMHGTFWSFPPTFSLANSAGIAPRSNYLKVIGDFARWNDRVVFGCDDSAKSEFLNRRAFKAARGAPIQSNSNLWFVDPARIDALGTVIGRGSVWLRDDLEAGQISDPYLFTGYDYRMLTIKHDNSAPVNFVLEVDKKGDGVWEKLRAFKVNGALIHIFDASERGIWVRISVDANVKGACAHFNYRNQEQRGDQNGAIFDSIAKLDEQARGKGVIRGNREVLSMVAADRYYELNDQLELTSQTNHSSKLIVAQGARRASGIKVDAASVIVVEDGRVYRLPKNPAYESLRASAIASTEKKSLKKTLEHYLPQSLTKDAAVAVSSTHQNFKAEHLVDGVIDDNSRWISGGSKSWLTIDLGAPKIFRSVYIATGWKREPQYAAKNFDVQIKQGEAWVTLSAGTIRNNSHILVPVLLNKPVKAQEIKIEFKDDGFNRVYEVAIFADQPEISDYNRANLEFARVCREVATERDLFNFHGTFYELPARNAQGFAKIRPIATHNLLIHDYASHFGMLFLTGVNGQTNDRVIRSADGATALWAGVIDDLWQLGKPRGEGGVWKDTPVKRGQPSDPYLMTAYDRKSATLLSSTDTDITLEIDIDGTEIWIPCETFHLKGGTSVIYEFPEGFSAYWIRAVSSADIVATVMFKYD